MASNERRTLQQLAKIVPPFFVSELRWRATGMLLLLAVFSISINSLDALMSYIGRDFMTALSLRERDDFLRQLYRYLGAFAIATPVVVFFRYTEERLGLMWRRWFSRLILKRYLQNRAYYKINYGGKIDNPDQRIEEDIRSFTSTSLSFLLIVFNSMIKLFLFTGILWSISTSLVYAVFAYAAVGSLITYLVGRPLIGLNFAQLKKDADYRYKLINVRDNSESIAFIGDEGKELTRSRQRLKIALDNLLRIINWNRNLSLFTTGYNYVVVILPTIIVAPLFLDGKIEFGVVTQASFLFAHVLGALSIIVTHFQGLSTLAAVINRLGSFWEALEEIERQPPNYSGGIKTRIGELVRFDDVTIVTPKREQVLIRNLSFELSSGGLLISGPSGSGKSSILRVLTGLWTSGSGSIVRPPLNSTMILPQRPYMVLGTLRNQLLYGSKSTGYLDEELLKVIHKVGLYETFKRVGGFESTLDWANILSTGEQQRLAFARLLLSRPRFVVLDEATTAIDQDSEQYFFSLVKEFASLYITVGFHATLRRYHDTIIEIEDDGRCRVGGIKQSII
ncbi:MAG: ABC transporter ATP-binding protein/permease [Deltaproteobacteria bacterium]|nr:ABC transporter ATP-binding protein/permease [Deltaproteobacteria bacterium]